MEQGGKMKGYIVSLSAIILLSSMLLFSVFYSENINSRNTSINQEKKFIKLGFIKDNIQYDLTKITGTKINTKQKNGLEITVNDTLPSGKQKTERIKKLKDFLEGIYGKTNNANILLGITGTENITKTTFSNNLVYEYLNNTGKESIQFYSLNGNTDMNSVDLNIEVKGSSVYVSRNTNAVNADLILNFNYLDENSLNEKHEIIGLDSSIDNIITVRFSQNPEDTIEIHLGSFDGKTNAMTITNKTVNQNKTTVGFTARIPQEIYSIKAFAGIDLNYSQVDLNSDSQIEINT